MLIASLRASRVLLLRPLREPLFHAKLAKLGAEIAKNTGITLCVAFPLRPLRESFHAKHANISAECAKNIFLQVVLYFLSVLCENFFASFARTPDSSQVIHYPMNAVF
jgi:hypothetical protein